MNSSLSTPTCGAKPAAKEAVPAIETSYKARGSRAFSTSISIARSATGSRFFRKAGDEPGPCHLCSATAGIVAGHLYYYPDLRLNLLGMVLHVCSNALDNADGQLARLTKQGSRTGRVLDGFADRLVFVSIYAHLCLRYTAGGGSHFVWLLALAAGASHSLQSAAADYCRNAWLYFSQGKSLTGLDSSHSLQLEFEHLSWRAAPWKKFLLRLYLTHTRLQEWLLPRLRELEQVARETHRSRHLRHLSTSGRTVDRMASFPPPIRA